MDNDDLGNLIGMNQRNQTNQRLRRLEQQRRGVGPCPYCGGGLPKLGVSVCMHCQKDLVWYKNVVGKPGQEALCKSQYTKKQASVATHRRASDRRQAALNQKLLKYCGPAFFLYIPFFLYCLITGNPGRLFLVDIIGYAPVAIPIALAWPIAALIAVFAWISPVDSATLEAEMKDTRPRCSKCGKNKFGAKKCPHCKSAG
jgi:hypothetical protein